MIASEILLLLFGASGSISTESRVAPAFGAHVPKRRILLQYQASVGPFVSVHQVEEARPGIPSGGSIAYRPTLTQYTALAGPMISAPTVLVLRGDWSHTELPPVRARRVRQAVSWVAPLRVADVTAAVIERAWAGWQPERLRRRELIREGQARVSFAAAIPTLDPSRFGWRGVYPDWLTRRGTKPAAQQWQALETPVQYPIPGVVSWLPQAPHWLRSRQPLAELTGFTVNVDPLPNAASPDLAWKGWQPDWLRRARGVVEYPSYTQPPKLTPFVPDLVGGLSVYPDRLPLRALIAGAQRTWADRFHIVIPDLRRDWSPVYPDLLWKPRTQGLPAAVVWLPAGNPGQLPTDWRKVGPDRQYAWPRRVTVSNAAVFPPPIDIFTGELLAWEPDRVYFPIRRVNLLDTPKVAIVNPGVPGGGIPCVEIVEGCLTLPTLLAGELTTPGLICPAFTLSQGQNGALC